MPKKRRKPNFERSPSFRGFEGLRFRYWGGTFTVMLPGVEFDVEVGRGGGTDARGAWLKNGKIYIAEVNTDVGFLDDGYWNPGDAKIDIYVIEPDMRAAIDVFYMSQGQRPGCNVKAKVKHIYSKDAAATDKAVARFGETGRWSDFPLATLVNSRDRKAFGVRTVVG